MSEEGLWAEPAGEKVESTIFPEQKALACSLAQIHQMAVQDLVLDQPGGLLHGWNSAEENAALLAPSRYLY